MKKISKYIIATVLLLSFGIGLTSSNIVNEVKRQFNITTDTVEIEIINKTAYNNTVVPTKTIPFDVNVKNLGANCYIRFKAEVLVNDENTILLTDDDIKVNDTFKNINGYYYTDEILSEDKEIALYDEVSLPQELKIKSNDEIEVITTVEVIQSSNFKQDFTSENVWGNEKIEKSINSRLGVIQ